ncbi:hypothetical protein HO173_006973 [Letharia columbiana]|uniref:Uncharacterized protein n=1 Tax=Letharia columbiana TaxID=112416 RepID=A0A8H6FU27_9LECA|nr:uncharacterized protein HO173_006973 [Letharia columbiana]KAF6234753.1 hypothetical protein HO173_006973 [Letharia columbiana]
MDNSNIKSEPVNKKPTIKDEPRSQSPPMKTIKNAPRFPSPPPPPSLPPPNPRALPPRTTRAHFITPDQRAIFGPAVEPFERTDRVGALPLALHVRTSLLLTSAPSLGRQLNHLRRRTGWA